MMDYKIRIATKNDVKNLAILKQKIWDQTFRGIYSDDIIDNFDYEETEETFIKIINNDKISLYVVESNNELVGFMDVGVPIRGFDNYEQEIGLLYLRKDFQRRGIGKELFTIGYNEIKSSGYSEFFISCNKYNMNARKFYEKMGGQLISVDEDNDNKRIVQVKYHYDVEVIE